MLSSHRSHILLNTARAHTLFGTWPVILDEAATTCSKLRVEQSSESAYDPTKIVARSSKQRKDFILKRANRTFDFVSLNCFTFIELYVLH